MNAVVVLIYKLSLKKSSKDKETFPDKESLTLNSWLKMLGKYFGWKKTNEHKRGEHIR